MVSKKSWEKFKRDVEGLTKTGVERESWGRRLSNKDLNDSFSRKQRKATPVGHSSEADGKTDDDIKGFSSSDEEEGVPTRKCLTGSKRTLSRSVSGKARKRQKKCNSPVKSPVKFSQSTSDFPRAKQLRNSFIEKWKAVTSDFENSFTAASTSALSLRSPNLSPTSDDTKDSERKEETNKSEDIAWSDSDSDSEQPVLGEERVTTTSQDKIPFSSQFKDIEQDGKGKHAVDIVEFDSDPESIENSADKESSPSISPNTPTPTPKSPKEDEVEGCPPLDSSKKRKQKYLRSGLAERLRKLIARENSDKSFWFHKLQQLKEDSNDDDHSRQADGTVTLRLVSENLDHGVHVIKCDVIAHDVISERELPDQVIILLDSGTRKHLEFKSKPSYLRIYSPWKIFDLTNFSLPILLCITHCEVISVLPSHLKAIANETFEVPAVLSTASQVNQLRTKVVRTTLFSSSVCDKKVSDVSWNDDEEDNKKLVDGKGESVKETDSPVLVRNLLDAIALQGQVLNTRISFTARIQRIYWRNVRQRNQTVTLTGSLVSSIIEHSRSVKEQNNMSLCFLVQDSAALCSEIRLSSNDLLRRPDWQELLFRAEGSALSFRGLRFVEHRKRKRRPDVFGLIDSLRCRTRDTETDSSKCTVKQNVCFTLLMDEQTDVQPLSADEVNDCSSYDPPKPLTVDDLRNNRLFDRTRVKLYGKLLHATFKSDERYDTKHVQLFISDIFIAEESSEGNISKETFSECVIQVRYSSGRNLEWNKSTLLPGLLLLMQDLIVDKESPAILTADTFSKIQVLISQSAFLASSSTPAFHTDDLWRKMMNVPMDDVKYNRLKSLSHTVLPELSVETESDNLVMFEGTIIDVDQVNAFCWFTCNECGSDDISELQENSLYICNACGMDIRSPVTNTHLEVYLNSMTSPVVRVKAKLLQSTISRLLPLSEAAGEEGYDVQCVLNKHLGPMSCYVLAKFKDEKKQEDPKISFKLEELDAIKWTQ